MIKSELIDRLAIVQPHLPYQDVEKVVKVIIEQMCQSLATGQRVEIRGFGAFSLRYRAPRTKRNPKTGDSVELPAKHVIHFKTGKELRDRVNKSRTEGKPIKDTEHQK